MGLDSLNPYLEYVKNKEKGLFVLIRTSNEGAKDIQYISDKNGEKVYNAVGKKLLKLGEAYLGESGYSSIGGVMGCTHAEEGIQLRKDLSSLFFLIPGYGAQGGKAEDVALYLKDGNGGVVNSSRGILLGYKKYENGESKFSECARLEAIKMKEDILKHIK
jgi:orotidine-5'-phosphate decarboxylase